MATAKKAATKTTATKTTATAAKTTNKSVSLEKIKAKAFEIYLATGNSNEQENWLKAEKELRIK